MKSLKERLEWAMQRMDPVPSVIEIADGCHVKRASVYLWLYGTTKTLQPETARHVAKYFGVNRDWLETGVGDPVLGIERRATPDASLSPDAQKTLVRLHSQLADAEETIRELRKSVEAVTALKQAPEKSPVGRPGVVVIGNNKNVKRPEPVESTTDGTSRNVA